MKIKDKDGKEREIRSFVDEIIRLKQGLKPLTDDEYIKQLAQNYKHHSRYMLF